MKQEHDITVMCDLYAIKYNLNGNKKEKYPDFPMHEEETWSAFWYPLASTQLIEANTTTALNALYAHGVLVSKTSWALIPEKALKKGAIAEKSHSYMLDAIQQDMEAEELMAHPQTEWQKQTAPAAVVAVDSNQVIGLDDEDSNMMPASQRDASPPSQPPAAGQRKRTRDGSAPPPTPPRKQKPNVPEDVRDLVRQQKEGSSPEGRKRSAEDAEGEDQKRKRSASERPAVTSGRQSAKNAADRMAIENARNRR
jgi:uncharacterized protein YdbL (DUF1318 family)